MDVMNNIEVNTKILLYESYAGATYGNGIYISLILKYLGKKDYDFTLACPTNGDLPKAAIVQGARVEIVHPDSNLMQYGGQILRADKTRRIQYVYSVIKYNLRIIKLLVKYRFDLIHCNNLRSLLMVGFAAKIMRVPCLYFVKGEIYDSFLDKIGIYLADRVIFLSDYLKKPLRSFLAKLDKIRDLKIGIPYNEIKDTIIQCRQKTRQQLRIGQSTVNFCFGGILTRDKGVDVLLKAFKRVIIAHPHTRLYVAGDSDEMYNLKNSKNKGFKQELHNIVSENGMESHVFFTGWRSDFPCILSNMDVYVLPSLSEGVPRSIIEAMALGLPVIATNVGGIPDIVKNGQNGILVPVKDEERLAEAMIKLGGDAKLRQSYGDKGKEIALPEYTIDKHFDGLERIYNELLH